MNSNREVMHDGVRCVRVRSFMKGSGIRVRMYYLSNLLGRKSIAGPFPLKSAAEMFAHAQGWRVAGEDW